MKKALSLFAALAICVTMLGACGKDEAKKIESAEDLEGATIGVQLGTTGDNYAEDVKDAKVEKYNKGADAVQALKQGKVDAVVIDNEPAKVFVEKNSDLKILEEEFTVEDYAIAMNLENTALQSEINGALSELKADGTINNIVNNWIGDDAPKTPCITAGDDTSKGKLIMATNAEFPPYESMSDGKIVGIDVDIMQAICNKLGYELEIENTEFDSIIPEIQSGKADVGVAGMTVNEDRKKNVLFSDSYATGVQVIIVKK